MGKRKEINVKLHDARVSTVIKALQQVLEDHGDLDLSLLAYEQDEDEED